MLVKAARAGAFDVAAWTAATQAAEPRDFDQTLAAIATHRDVYATLLGEMSDADFRGEIEMFGSKTTRGSFIVNMVLCGCAAYRMQLFLYLKACGREELGTSNLWRGADAPGAAKECRLGGACGAAASSCLSGLGRGHSVDLWRGIAL